MRSRWSFLFAFILVPSLARADVKPHALISEGMVLQQKSNAKIWGTADKGEQITISFRRTAGGSVEVQSVATEADNEGRWSAFINTGGPGGPFELTIKGKNTISFKNILVGEVWVCSGQSNMEWKVSGCVKSDQDYATSAKANSMLRIFHVTKSPQGTPQSETSGPTPKSLNYGHWIEAQPKTVSDFSAAAYFFGRHLQENMKLPVGLVHTSWGGTRIETWMSAKALDATGFKIAPAKAQNEASALFNGMLHPILNYSVKGAIWYQGESNVGNALQYRTLQADMIQQWRADFKNPELAFHFVQLAPYTAILKKPGESNWAELREAQTLTLAKLKNVGMAVITDFGDEADIHPSPKRPVGERLALAARGVTYGEKIVYSGPIYKNCNFRRDGAVLAFDHVGGGLVGKEIVSTPSRNVKAKDLFAWRVKEGSSNAPLVGFTMCGKDKIFHEAKAEIVENRVVVSCDKVDTPFAVRYGWANHPVCNLYNREGLPASPFRTDDLPGVTAPKK